MFSIASLLVRQERAPAMVLLHGMSALGSLERPEKKKEISKIMFDKLKEILYNT
jgi:hypothetical protein